MPKRLSVLALVVICLPLLAVPTAVADETEAETEKTAEELVEEHKAEDHKWDMKWSNGFKLESADKAFKLKFGGRIQVDYQFVSADTAEGVQEALELQDGIEFRRARLFMEGTIYERVLFKAQYDFAGGDTDFKDVFVGLDFDGWRLLFGHNKEAFSLGELTSSKYLAFLERASATQTFAPSRNSGINALGNVGDKINWGLGVFYDTDDFGISGDEDNKNITGRFVFRPIYQDKGQRLLHLGLSATSKNRADSIRFRSRPEAHQANRFLDTGSFAADSAFIWDLELAGVFNRFWFQGEYFKADVDSPEFDDPSFDGYYIQAGFYLTDDYRRYKTKSGSFDRQKPSRQWPKKGGGAWEIGVRYGKTDLNDSLIAGNASDSISLGLNWYPNPATRMMINYISSSGDFGIAPGDSITLPNGEEIVNDSGRIITLDAGSVDIFLVRWQVDF